MKKLFLILVLLLVHVTTFAGAVYEVKCHHCDFNSQINSGGTKLMASLQGYCSKCKKNQMVHWKRESKKAPHTIKVWDSLTGKTRELFFCPDCGKLVFVIEDVKDIKFCPKCKRDKLESKLKMCID
jgi:hypothetical protein